MNVIDLLEEARSFHAMGWHESRGQRSPVTHLWISGNREGVTIEVYRDRVHGGKPRREHLSIHLPEAELRQFARAIAAHAKARPETNMVGGIVPTFVGCSLSTEKP